MFTAKKPVILIAFLFGLVAVLTACNLPTAQQPPTQEPNLVHTLAAQTVVVRLTQQATDGGQVATLAPTQAVVATATQAAVPTATQQPPTATVMVPTATNMPPTATPVPCNLMEYVKDINYPDGEDVQPGETIEKTWRLKNIGSCTWGSGYSLVFDHGDAMGAPASTQLTNGQVPPGSTVDVTVTLKMPTTPGEYQGYFKLRDSYNNTFGYVPNDKAFWVKLEVVNPSNYDFADQADNASWRNGSDALPWGDQNNDTPGIAALLDDFKLEDNKVYDDVLVTYPQRITDGVITGVFGKYEVQVDDHFRATVGFAANCSGGKVKFQLFAREGNNTTLLKEWEKSCNGELLNIDYDLEDLEGHEINFILGVTANGPFDNDKAVWLNPRIQD